jgi:hypothetical protein
VKTGVVLKLPTHRMVRRDVVKGIKRSSPMCVQSYGRSRDCSEGGHGDIVFFCTLYTCVGTWWLVAVVVSN